ncbi:MAG: hypothetical protein LBE20_07025 [Deltaproteobacteria bacterium]|jgi:hypothetical protein|nr:hypothetical protein [Deltaproteobacteria bacterium]
MSNINIENVWGAISGEEKDELLARAQANGIFASFVFIVLTTSAAFGFNQPWVIFVGIFCSVIIMPLFANRTWRVQKPTKILQYLAVRSVARRYAYGFGLRRIDITMLMRGYLQEVNNQTVQDLNFEQLSADELTKNTLSKKKEVWICLIQSGILVISEKLGGAKLEFISNFDKGIQSHYLPSDRDNSDGYSGNAIILASNIKSRKKIIVLTSDYIQTLNSLNNIIEIKKSVL